MKPGELPPGRVACRHCGYPIRVDSVVCRFCRLMQTEDGGHDGPRAVPPGAAASLLFGGIGLGAALLGSGFLLLDVADWVTVTAALLGTVVGVPAGVYAIARGLDAFGIARSDPRYESNGTEVIGTLLALLTLLATIPLVMGLLLR